MLPLISNQGKAGFALHINISAVYPRVKGLLKTPREIGIVQSISRSNLNFLILVKRIESLMENDFCPDILLALIEVFVELIKPKC
jgi:hypothetical protein